MPGRSGKGHLGRQGLRGPMPWHRNQARCESHPSSACRRSGPRGGNQNGARLSFTAADRPAVIRRVIPESVVRNCGGSVVRYGLHRSLEREPSEDVDGAISPRSGSYFFEPTLRLTEASCFGIAWRIHEFPAASARTSAFVDPRKQHEPSDAASVDCSLEQSAAAQTPRFGHALVHCFTPLRHPDVLLPAVEEPGGRER